MRTDEEYVATLRTMLTGLNPIGSGTGARVTSVRVVSDAGYDELEIEFDAVVGGVDRGSGSVRVDIDREWRELSGYDEPETYVRRVAGELERAVRLVASPPRAIAAVDPDLAWADLLRNLGYQGAAREVGDARIEVTGRRGDVFTVLVTREQWAELWAHHGDDFFHDLLGPRAEDESFIVFHRGDLARSVREELPPVRSISARLFHEEMLRRTAEARAQDPDAPLGWFTYRPGDDPSSDQERFSPG